MDARQQAELGALLQSNSWTRRSVPARLGLLLLVVTPTVLVVGLLASLATAHWIVITACLTLSVLLVPFELPCSEYVGRRRSEIQGPRPSLRLPAGQ